MDNNWNRLELRPLIASLAILFSAAASSAVPGKQHEVNNYGGAVYQGTAQLELVSALVQAGGGPEGFSFQTALINMLGQPAANDEINKLDQQYGTEQVQDWLQGTDWTVRDGVVKLKATGTNLPPPPSDLSSSNLASGLVDAGIAPDDTTFWSGYYYDHLFSHSMNQQLSTDVDRKYNPYFTKNMYMITNQAMYDISQQVHTHNIRLAKLH